MRPELLESAAPGRDVAALAWGDPGAPVVILVHGFPDTAWTWRYLGPALADQGWRVIAPFTRGYAPTGITGDYDIGALVADVHAVRAAHSRTRPALLVGHDWGGAIVSAVASSDPAGFAAVAILAIPPLPAIVRGALRPRGLLALVRQAPRSWYMAFFQLPGLAERVGPRLFDLLWRAWAPSYDSRADREHLRTALPDRAHRRAAITYYRAMLNPWVRRRAAAGTYRRAFGRLRLPTLYLHGSDDTCGRVDLGDRALDYCPPDSARIVVPDAGHFLHLEAPDRVGELITTWAATHRPTAGSEN
ncbi:alpha/beta fold hydrolase [Nocardia stercoris]|uniref:Alpha/beta hydrolase n=1 Tax=Nocardia stercoris TaxID=2483361 RepID=A0A3M2KXD6_9NOCA|nr:alpha/beta hydrolase [Nocardia stercoris]RMI30187.1 alpha/beta hydrolase [Nocardia stercoris]